MTANLTRLIVPTDHRLAVAENHVSRTGGQQSDSSGVRVSAEALTPPSTPAKSGSSNETQPEPEITPYDFSKIDYELDRAKLLGSGLWSDVFLAEAKSPQSDLPSPSALLTPPATPQKLPQSTRKTLYAVKLPTRPDANEVFALEAKILTRVHRHMSSETYVVPFHGLDPRNHALIFTALQSGSLQDLTSRMSQMTEVCRHQELVLHFPTLAEDLTQGLAFLQNTAGVIHADIKPANILLSPSPYHPRRYQARYADFSASFLTNAPDSATNSTAGGGTWTFLAPEQLRLSKSENQPSPASDVWSLGLTLLSLIILGSPYAAACGNNMFRLREGIKAGDPLGFAAMDPLGRKRIQACQGFIDCCRLALQKDKEKRVGAEAWKGWVERQWWGDRDEV